MYVKTLEHYTSDRTGKKMQLLYTYATAWLSKVKNEYTTGVNVDNGRDDITDGSVSDHLTTRFIHVHIWGMCVKWQEVTIYYLLKRSKVQPSGI